MPTMAQAGMDHAGVAVGELPGDVLEDVRVGALWERVTEV